jgi:hypothetical protein
LFCVAISCYLCPTEKREYNSSAEEPLDRQEHYETSKRNKRKKTSKLLTKKVVRLKRVCIFAVPNKGSAGVDGLRLMKGLRLLKKL